MSNTLNAVLNKIGADYGENIRADSRFYMEVNIGRKADELGLADVNESYRNIYAIVPLKQPVSGMKVRVDGRTFVNYCQFESGIVLPRHIARQAGMPHRDYVAQDSMICNFA